MKELNFNLVEINNSNFCEGNWFAINWWHEELGKSRKLIAIGGSRYTQKE